MRRGLLPYCVLAMLRDTERYGFELVQALGSVDGMVTGQGTIYPLLSRLRKAWWAPRGGNPPRARRGATTSSPRAARRQLAGFTHDWDRELRDSVEPHPPWRTREGQAMKKMTNWLPT